MEGLKTVRVDFGGGRGDTVRAFKNILAVPLNVGEVVRALDDDGTDRLASVIEERDGSFVLRINAPDTPPEIVGDGIEVPSDVPSLVFHSVRVRDDVVRVDDQSGVVISRR